jgi:hypothetical protein
VLDGARAKPEPSAAGHARGHSAAASRRTPWFLDGNS